jgi:antitoxin YefM
MQVITFSELRGHLKEVLDSSADQHEPIVIKRPRGENMVLLSLTDYESLKETAYLLSSEANTKHLRKSIRSLRKGKLLKKDLLEE